MRQDAQEANNNILDNTNWHTWLTIKSCFISYFVDPAGLLSNIESIITPPTSICAPLDLIFASLQQTPYMYQTLVRPLLEPVPEALSHHPWN